MILREYVNGVVGEAEAPVAGKEAETEPPKETQKYNGTIYTITCNDPDKRLKSLLDYIQKTGNIGHSFDIVVDPDNKETTKKFGWDGDGADSIKDIKEELIQEEPKAE